MPRLLSVLLLFAVSGSAQAQFTISGPPTSTSLRTIDVRGSGDASAPHDRAVLRISFDSKGDTAEEALATHQAEVGRIQSILMGAGVPQDQIFLDRSGIGSTRSRGGMMGGSDEGFSASRQLTVHVDDLDAVPTLVAAIASDKQDDLLAVNQRQVNVSYVVQEADALQQQALRDAVADARQRAELIADVAGLSLAEVLSVREDGAGGSVFDAMNANAMAGMMDEMAGGGEYRVRVGVSVSFSVR